jgi:peptidoglycan/xylan/chitin deacetylase (PgdA/CDA1 family)
MTHPRLSSLTDEEQRYEIAKCKDVLQSILDTKVTAFAYPYGTVRDYNADSVRIVREAGYAVAVSNQYGPVEQSSDRFTLRRINIDATDTLETFAAKVDGRLDALQLLESDLGVYARSALNRLLKTG